MEANRIYDIALEYNVNYINFLTQNNVVNYNTDCLDTNSHLNAAGGKKVTYYIGDYITSQYAIADHRQDFVYSFWHDDYALYLKYKIDLLKAQNILSNYLMLLEDNDFMSIPAPFEPTVRTLRATLPALRATFPVSGNHHSGVFES